MFKHSCEECCHLHTVPVEPSYRNGGGGIEPEKGYIGNLDQKYCVDVVVIAVAGKYADKEAVEHFKLD